MVKTHCHKRSMQMSSEVREAVVSQPEDLVAQPQMEPVTPEERLILRYYRQLDVADQVFIRRALEAAAWRAAPY